MAAPQMGAVAFRIDKSDAESVLAAMEKSRNGNAEFRRPSTRKCFQLHRTFKLPFRNPPTTNRKTAASPTRISISSTGPRTGTQIRMKRNDAPKIADSDRRRKRLGRLIGNSRVKSGGNHSQRLLGMRAVSGHVIRAAQGEGTESQPNLLGCLAGAASGFGAGIPT